MNHEFNTLSTDWILHLVPLFFILGLITIYAGYRLGITYFSSRTLLLGYPLLGLALDLTPEKFMGPMQELCRKYGPVFDIYITVVRLTVVANVKDVSEILSKRLKYFRRSDLVRIAFSGIRMNEGLFMSENPEWGIHRRVSSPAFSKKALTSHTHDIWNKCIEACHNIVADGTTVTEFTDISMSFTVRIISLVAFGTDANESVSYFFTDQFKSDLHIMLKYASTRAFFGLPEFLWRLSPYYKYEVANNEVMGRIEQLSRDFITMERLKPAKIDNYYYLHQLVHAEGELKLTDTQIMHNIITVFFAGTDTTSIVLSWSMYFLSINKKLLADVRVEVDIMMKKVMTQEIPIEEAINHIPLLIAVFKETLRLRGPVSGIVAQLQKGMKELTLSSGTILYEKDVLWLCVDYISLDPNVYDDPYTCNPYRWLTQDIDKLAIMETYFLAFGGGPRVCPGMHLSYLEGPLFLAHLVSMYDFDLTCPPNEVEQIASVTTKCSKCPLLFTPRKV